MVFPLAGIITARFCVERLSEKLLKWMFPLHVILMAGLWAITFYLINNSFNTNVTTSIVLFVVCLIISIYLTIKSSGYLKMVYLLLLTVIAVNFFLNYHVYPRLLKFQPTGEIGRILKDKKVPLSSIYNLTAATHSLDFYAEQMIQLPDQFVIDKWINKSFTKGDYLIVDSTNLLELKNSNLKSKIIFTGNQFQVSMVTGEFLNPDTRPGTLKPIYLVQID